MAGLEYMKAHPTNEGALCPKGNAFTDLIYHKERLQYPLKKVDEHFERIDWDEALSLVASNLDRVRHERSPNALAFLASAKATNEENFVMQKLARLLGTNNIDHCARL